MDLVTEFMNNAVSHVPFMNNEGTNWVPMYNAVNNRPLINEIVNDNTPVNMTYAKYGMKYNIFYAFLSRDYDNPRRVN